LLFDSYAAVEDPKPAFGETMQIFDTGQEGVGMNNKNGFTLIELMTTLAVIAIISALTIPNMIGWVSNRRIRSAVEEISAVAQLARQRAIRENENVVITMDLGGDKCEVFIDADNDHIRDGSEAIVESIFIPKGVNMYEYKIFDGAWFGYSGRGLPIDSRDGEIHLKNTAGSFMGIKMDITGNPTIIQSDNGYSWY
jgi:prepilin-type N-terminal cleavage/methylation domain-containing protein